MKTLEIYSKKSGQTYQEDKLIFSGSKPTKRKRLIKYELVCKWINPNEVKAL